jgi:hypothetical protein
MAHDKVLPAAALPSAAAVGVRVVLGFTEPKGFVNLALEKGYKMLFQASSDHISAP